jgi:hypothetical protein
MSRVTVALFLSLLPFAGCDSPTRSDGPDLSIIKAPGHSYGLSVVDIEGRELLIGQYTDCEGENFDDTPLPRAHFVNLPMGYRFHGRSVQDAPIYMFESDICREPPPALVATGSGHYVINSYRVGDERELRSLIINVQGTVGGQRVHVRSHFLQTPSGEIRHQGTTVRYSH